MRNGRLISFEGLDGAGKTTQIGKLEPWLKAHHLLYTLTCEPGGTELGRELRKLLLYHSELEIASFTEVFLFQADRAQHFEKVIIPALNAGKLVITDRCFDTSIAYQGYGQGIEPELVEELSLIATQGRVPDLTILLDLDPSKVHERVSHIEQLHLPTTSRAPYIQASSICNQDGEREELNRLDTQPQSFHQRVRNGYLTLARAHPERIKVVDASRSPEEVHQEVVALVEQLLES